MALSVCEKVKVCDEIDIPGVGVLPRHPQRRYDSVSSVADAAGECSVGDITHDPLIDQTR